MSVIDSTVLQALNEINDKTLIKDVPVTAKLQVLDYIFDLACNADGIDVVAESKILATLVNLIGHPEEKLSMVSARTLANVIADESGATAIMNLPEIKKKEFLDAAFSEVCNADSSAADTICIVLRNLSAHSKILPELVRLMEPLNESLSKLLVVFRNVKHNKRDCGLHDLAHFFGNMAANPEIRRVLLDVDQKLIESLATFLDFNESDSRRSGVINAIKNCCFETESHEWLVGEEIDLLPRILLPLMGSDEFDDEDTEKLPLMLQYVEKERDTDPSNRKKLLETLLQLCTTKKVREYIRDKNTYVILREYHKWEKNREVLLSCENIIDILIRTEEEIGTENLNSLTVPDDLVKKFEDMDASYIADT